jgi:hypothetical protein
MTSFEIRNQNGLGEITTPKYFVAGLGYSPSSASPSGGSPAYGFEASPSVFSSTFFGSDVKGLLPQFGKKSKKKTKKSSKRKRRIGRKMSRKSRKRN